MNIVFLERRLVERLHDVQIQRFGGASGLRDENAFESALARAINKAFYGCEDIFELAAAYLYGLAKNHAFVDGNKRIAIVATAVFLMDNGFEIATDEAVLYTFVFAVAAGEIDEDGATRFLRDVSVPYSG
jgi:death-on-curing protein